MYQFYLNLTGFSSLVVALLSLFFIGWRAGMLWTWVCGLTGATYLLSLSQGLRSGDVAILGEMLDSALSVIAPEQAGPVTMLIRERFGTRLSGVCSDYIARVESSGMFGIDGTDLSVGGLVINFLIIVGLSIILPLLAGLYCNAETALILFAVNMVLRIIRRQWKKQKAVKTAASGETQFHQSSAGPDQPS